MESSFLDDNMLENLLHPTAMSKRTTYLRFSVARIELALAVAGVGLALIGANPTPVPTISVEAQVDDPFPSSGDAVTLTASADGPTGATCTYQSDACMSLRRRRLGRAERSARGRNRIE